MAVSWEYGAVAFLDILGFAGFVEGDAESVSPKHLERLLNCLAEVRSTTEASLFNLRSFSDSIVLAADLAPEPVIRLLVSVVGLQRTFINRGVLVRGGIALGKHYADAESVYSQALVRAFRLEHDNARFPRILLDDNLLDWLMNDEECTSELREQLSSLLLRDRDGQIFISYLDGALIESHANLIDSYNGQRMTASVLDKVQWLARYHNYVAESLGHDLLIDGPLVAGFAAI